MTEDRERPCTESLCWFSPGALKQIHGPGCPNAPAPPAEEKKIEPASEKHYKGCRCENKAKSCDDGEAFIAAVRAANKVRIEQEPNDAPAMVSNALIAMLDADHQALVTAEERISLLEDAILKAFKSGDCDEIWDIGSAIEDRETERQMQNAALTAATKKEKKG